VADNLQMKSNVGAGTDLAGTDEIGGVHFQRIKMIHGADGVNDGDVSRANPYPVANFAGVGASTIIPAGTAAGQLIGTPPATATGCRMYFSPGESAKFLIASSQPAAGSEGLMAQWTFDNDNGENSLTPGTYDLTMTGATYSATGAKFTKSMTGGRGASTAIATALSALTQFQIDLHFKRSTANDLEVLVGAGKAFWLAIDASGFIKLNIGTAPSPTVLTGSTNLCDGAWHHAVATFSATGCKLLVDGAVVGTTSQTISSSGGSWDVGLDVRGFRSADANADFDFQGSIDNVSVWSTIQITGAYTVPTAPYSTVQVPSYTAGYSLTGPNWDEPLAGGQAIYILSRVGLPKFRYL
jgi:hypothetical protein